MSFRDFKKRERLFETKMLESSVNKIEIPKGYNHGHHYIQPERLGEIGYIENIFYNVEKHTVFKISYRKAEMQQVNMVEVGIVTNDKNFIEENIKFGWKKSKDRFRELWKLS